MEKGSGEFLQEKEKAVHDIVRGVFLPLLQSLYIFNRVMVLSFLSRSPTQPKTIPVEVWWYLQGFKVGRFCL